LQTLGKGMESDEICARHATNGHGLTDVAVLSHEGGWRRKKLQQRVRNGRRPPHGRRFNSGRHHTRREKLTSNSGFHKYNTSVWWKNIDQGASAAAARLDHSVATHSLNTAYPLPGSIVKMPTCFTCCSAWGGMRRLQQGMRSMKHFMLGCRAR